MGHSRAETAPWARPNSRRSTEWETLLSPDAGLTYPQGHPFRSQPAWRCSDLDATSTLVSFPSGLTSDTEHVRMFMQ